MAPIGLRNPGYVFIPESNRDRGKTSFAILVTVDASQLFEHFLTYFENVKDATKYEISRFSGD